MKNVYLAIVIVIAIAVVVGGAVIFLKNRSSKTVNVIPPVEESTQVQNEATGTPDTPPVLRDLGSTPEALQ